MFGEYVNRMVSIVQTRKQKRKKKNDTRRIPKDERRRK